MENTVALQNAVVEAADEFSAAREKLLRAEAAYNQALHKNATSNLVDKDKQQKFSSISTITTDC